MTIIFVYFNFIKFCIINSAISKYSYNYMMVWKVIFRHALKLSLILVFSIRERTLYRYEKKIKTIIFYLAFYYNLYHYTYFNLKVLNDNRVLVLFNLLYYTSNFHFHTRHEFWYSFDVLITWWYLTFGA